MTWQTCTARSNEGILKEALCTHDQSWCIFQANFNSANRREDRQYREKICNIFECMIEKKVLLAFCKSLFSSKPSYDNWCCSKKLFGIYCVVHTLQFKPLHIHSFWTLFRCKFFECKILLFNLLSIHGMNEFSEKMTILIIQTGNFYSVLFSQKFSRSCYHYAWESSIRLDWGRSLSPSSRPVPE